MAKTAFSEAELRAWFELPKYAPLRSATAADWAMVIYQRASLNYLIDEPAEKPISVKELFGRLRNNPLQDLGFFMGVSKQHPCDTSTVKLVTVDRVHNLSNEFSEIEWMGPGGLDSVDERLLNRTNIARDFVHLSIDPRTTKKQLVKDFSQFVSNWQAHVGKTVKNGDYEVDKLRRWYDRQIIQFFDLWFCGKLYGRSIEPQTYANLLGLGDVATGSHAKITLDSLVYRIREVVSFDCVHGLRTVGDWTFEPLGRQIAPPA